MMVRYRCSTEDWVRGQPAQGCKDHHGVGGFKGEAIYKGGEWNSPRSALGLQGGEEGWQQDVQREPSASHCYCGASLTSPKLMRLACFRISVSPSRSFILRYLGKVGVKRI